MTYTPVVYRIKVKPDSVEETTAGGIIIPTQVKDQEQLATTTGTVVAVGPGAFEGSPVLKPGDKILYAKYGGCVFREDGQEFRFINDEDVIAKGEGD